MSERVRRAIDVRTKRDAFVVELAQARERKDLITTAVGQQCVRPRHETLHAAEFVHELRTGSQHQVIGIGEDQLRAALHHVGRRL
jgi:hypothetical protein